MLFVGALFLPPQELHLTWLIHREAAWSCMITSPSWNVLSTLARWDSQHLCWQKQCFCPPQHEQKQRQQTQTQTNANNRKQSQTITRTTHTHTHMHEHKQTEPTSKQQRHKRNPTHTHTKTQPAVKTWLQAGTRRLLSAWTKGIGASWRAKVRKQHGSLASHVSALAKTRG